MKYHLIPLLLLAAALLGCRTREQSQEAVPESGFTARDEVVSIVPDSPLSAKLKLEQVVSAPLQTSFRTTASVEPKAGSVAEVGLPFGGRVTRSFVRLGDYVRRGQPLFEVSSPDYLDAVRDYFENENAAQLAEANRKRKETLFQSGLLSEREWEEVCAEARSARNASEISRQVLSIFHVNPADVKIGEPLKVCAPIAGRIVRSDLVIGTFLSAEAESPVTVADLSRVWITAHVRDGLTAGLKAGGKAIVETDSAQKLEGTIFYVGELLDEKTRTLPVVVECDNSARTLKPGMFVNALFERNLDGALVVPSSAVFQGEGTKYVYVRDHDWTFVKTPVSVESLDGGSQLVQAGLSAGQTIIADGGIYLSR